MTIRENKRSKRPKVVLSWAPHIKPLPQAVPNSFVEWMRSQDVDLTLTCPPGYELAEAFVADIPVVHQQAEALAGADFVYAKSWSSYQQYGTLPPVSDDWMLTEAKLAATQDGKFMHCLPVRRGVEVSDAVLDGPRSLVIQQADNRLWAAVAVLHSMLSA